MVDQRVVVEVVLKKGQVWGDSTDATKRTHINGWTERQWRHLDTCQFEAIIKARVPQLKYGDGTVEELTVPWAERYSRVTPLMAAFVIKLLEACPTTQAVCTLTRLSWSTVNAIMVSAVERGIPAIANPGFKGVVIRQRLMSSNFGSRGFLVSAHFSH